MSKILHIHIKKNRTYIFISSIGEEIFLGGFKMHDGINIYQFYYNII